VVRSGRLEVVLDGPPERVIRTLRRGEVLGELALLKGGARSASIRAQRDSELLEVGSSEFEALVHEAPSYALGLLRPVVAQVAVTSGVPAPIWLDHTAPLLGCELVVTGANVAASLLTALAPREVQVLPDAAQRRVGMEATARRLTGRAIGVVLSGGGARAFAH